MADVPLMMIPGVRTQATALLNSSSYVVSNLIRFRDANGQGYAALEKYGGWSKFSGTPVNGKGRGLLANSLKDASPYLVAGTERQIEIWNTDGVYDVTPRRKTSDLATPFTTSINSNVISVHDVAHGASAGDGIVLGTVSATGEIILQGHYDIVSVTDADNYIIHSAVNATEADAPGGATASFTTIDASPLITATLDNHGLAVGGTYTVGVATVVAGLTLLGSYTILSTPTADTFTFDADSNAAGIHTASENGGNVRINYLIANGSADAQQVQGFGLGGFGYGDFGVGEPSAGFLPPRRWYPTKWGQDFIASYTNGPLYHWDASAGFTNNPLTLITQAPAQATKIFLAMPQRQIIVLGAEDSGVQDPLLVKWCDIEDYTKWLAVNDPEDVDSQAGWFPITSGSRIVGGMQGPGTLMLWTDIGLWLFAYEGPPDVYGFNEVAQGCGLIGAEAAGVIGGMVMWMSQLGIFKFEGGVQQVPCDVWDKFFKAYDPAQAEKIKCCVSTDFNEIMWQAQSLGGTENDMYIKYNRQYGVWDYGPPGTQLARTDWIDKNVWGQPIGIGSDSYIYQHESGNDADISAMLSYAESGWMALNSGKDFMFIERFMPDFHIENNGTVNITFYMKEFPSETGPNNPLYTFGPFPVTALTNFCIVRGRNRFAKFRLDSSDLSSFWRIGKPIYVGGPTGER